MNKYIIIGIVAAGVVILAGIVILGSMDVPPPTGTVETELDDSRFPR